jgi:hypothetical protein
MSEVRSAESASSVEARQTGMAEQPTVVELTAGAPAEVPDGSETQGPAAGEGEEPLYEGTVHLFVLSNGNMQRVVRFVDELSKRPQFRLLRMTGNPQQEGAELVVGLREPTPFLSLLRSFGHTARPDSRSDNRETPRLIVRLGTQQAPERES